MSEAASAADLTHRLPTHDEIDSAAAAQTAIAQAKAHDGNLRIMGNDGREIRIAPAIGDLLVNLLGHVAQGKMVMLVPTGALLTTQEAADCLNVSRPFLSQLLKRGEIPFIPIGTHRRVKFEDLMVYKNRRDAIRHKGLDELVRLGQEFDEG